MRSARGRGHNPTARLVFPPARARALVIPPHLGPLPLLAGEGDVEVSHHVLEEYAHVGLLPLLERVHFALGGWEPVFEANDFLRHQLVGNVPAG